MPTEPSREPTAPVKPPVRGRGDTPPPAPPHELPRENTDARQFEHNGATWVARLSGKLAAGTGSYGLGLVEAVHFWRAAESDGRPLREALIARGRFEGLHEVELGELLERAVPVVPPPGSPPADTAPAPRRR